MKKAGRPIVIFTILLTVAVCSHAQMPVSYRQEMDNWCRQRVTQLKAENGWLNLAGLFWLENGKNSFGSATYNQIVFPKGSIPKKAGFFYRSGDTVSISAHKNVWFSINGKPVQQAILFQYDTATPVVTAYQNLRWTIIKRGNRLGIRLRNLNHPQLKKFKGINSFPLDTLWKTTATVQTENLAGTIPITNVLGQTTNLKLAGRLHFILNNQTYTLDALEEGNELFIIFADATNKQNTYPSGRFLYVPKPGANGQTVIDFNKAINPPCAFTPYATCPLPPQQNRLPVAITAGEQRYGNPEK